MEDLEQNIRSYGSRDLEQRKRWYSPAAEAYNQVRPHYPEALVQQVAAIAQLSTHSKLLEVGCGPGIATMDFAPLGCSMLCLEPNPDFCALAKQNCAPYSQIKIRNTAFEEWTVEPETFDAVLAASSFHWIPAQVGYPKAAQALRPEGSLILLWNKELQPRYDVYQQLLPVYAAYAPSLPCYEDWATQNEILNGLGQFITHSGYFQIPVAGQFECNVTYNVNEYLMLLSTYSPYLQLDPSTQTALFDSLRQVIDQEFGGTLELSYLSAFHVARKIESQ
jgi:SAM-dependent methyltransferase